MATNHEPVGSLSACSTRHAQKSKSNKPPVTAAQRFAREFSRERDSADFHCIVHRVARVERGRAG